MREAGRRTFRAISVRNYRLYFTGQVISVSGTWMQTVAQAYLILFPLHGTGVDVAIATSLQFLPALAARPLRRTGGGPGRQAQGALRHAGGRGHLWPSVLGVAVVTHSANLWDGLRVGGWPRVRQPLRQPGAPDLRLRDGRPRPAAQCREPQQRADELGPGDRARHRRRAHPRLRRGRLLLHQRRLLCRGDRRPRHDARLRALPSARRGPGQGPGPRGPALRVVHTRPEDPAPLHGPRRRVRLQLHRHPAAAGQIHLPRRRRPLQLVPGRHGRGRRRRRPRHGLPEPPVDPSPGEHRRHLRHRDPGGGPVADAGMGHRPAHPHGGGEHLVRGDQQRHPAAAGGPGHARPRRCRSTPSPSSAARPSGRRCSATSATSPARVWRSSSAVSARWWPASRSSCSEFGSAASGTEGLVMGLSAPAAPTNVVPLPVTEAGYEPRARRTS